MAAGQAPVALLEAVQRMAAAWVGRAVGVAQLRGGRAWREGAARAAGLCRSGGRGRTEFVNGEREASQATVPVGETDRRGSLATVAEVSSGVIKITLG